MSIFLDLTGPGDAEVFFLSYIICRWGHNMASWRWEKLWWKASVGPWNCQKNQNTLAGGFEWFIIAQNSWVWSNTVELKELCRQIWSGIMEMSVLMHHDIVVIGIRSDVDVLEILLETLQGSFTNVISPQLVLILYLISSSGSPHLRQRFGKGYDSLKEFTSLCCSCLVSTQTSLQTHPSIHWSDSEN